jgi:hypothetical protein
MTRSPRITLNHAAAVCDQLSLRELDIVSTLRRVRMACTRQIQRLHFTAGTPLANARQCRQTLKHLSDLGVVMRLERTVGGVRAGSAGHIYSLSVVGQRLAGGKGPAGGQRVRPPWTPGRLFVRHALAVTEVYVGLSDRDRRGELALLDFQTEPTTWRRFVGGHGVVRTVKPDASATVARGEWEHSWLVEVDLGTESASALHRKLTLYREFYNSGRGRIDGVFPRVVILVSDEHRYEQVLDVVGRQPAAVWALFQVGYLDRATDVLSGAGS